VETAGIESAPENRFSAHFRRKNGYITIGIIGFHAIIVAYALDNTLVFAGFRDLSTTILDEFEKHKYVVDRWSILPPYSTPPFGIDSPNFSSLEELKAARYLVSPGKHTGNNGKIWVSPLVERHLLDICRPPSLMTSICSDGYSFKCVCEPAQRTKSFLRSLPLIEFFKEASFLAEICEHIDSTHVNYTI